MKAVESQLLDMNEAILNLPAAGPKTAKTRLKRWLFRFLALFLGLSVFGVAETACILFDWGRPTEFDDPFVGFSAVHPLFVLRKAEADDDASSSESSIAARYEIPKSRRKFFAPESFPAKKATNTFRVFCLGGSTVQGRPYSKPTSFTTWLQLSLKASDPTRNWEVVNCGGISYASYRLVPILQECLGYNPDLFIICTGHNEFLEDRTYGHIRRAPKLVSVTHETLSRFRTYALLRAGLLGLAPNGRQSMKNDRPVLTAEVDAVLDYRDSLKFYHRDSGRRTAVIEHFEHNLRRMLAIAADANVPVILIRPPSNLSDCPPFKSQHRDDLTADELRQWESLVARAKEHYRGDVRGAIDLLKDAIRIDGEYAVTHYELGKCYETLKMQTSARRAFLQAKERDICPLRILRPMEQAVFDVARGTKTPLIDAHELLEKQSSQGILGDYMLVDHIHPSIPGHRLIADAIADELLRQGWLTQRAGWIIRRESAYKDHQASLDDMYYLRGQRTLDSLRQWTQGRADGPPLSQKPKPKAKQKSEPKPKPKPHRLSTQP